MNNIRWEQPYSTNTIKGYNRVIDNNDFFGRTTHQIIIFKNTINKKYFIALCKNKENENDSTYLIESREITKDEIPTYVKRYKMAAEI
jgi:hypothetical protein